MDTIKIKVAKFTTEPNTRELGIKFRRDVLDPALQSAAGRGSGPINAQVEVNMDGNKGYPTSFLRGAFGGLAKVYGLGALSRALKIVSVDEPMLVEEIFHYIQEDYIQEDYILDGHVHDAKPAEQERAAKAVEPDSIVNLLARYARALAQVNAARAFLAEYANAMSMHAKTIRMLSLKVNDNGRLTNLGGTLVGPGPRDHESLVDYYRMLQGAYVTIDTTLNELRTAGVDLSLLRKPARGDLPTDED